MVSELVSARSSSQQEPAAVDITPDMSCSEVLMTLSTNFIRNSDPFLHVFRNSGKDYNDYGRFSDCTEIHDFNYYIATVLHKFPIPFTLGFCLPN